MCAHLTQREMTKERDEVRVGQAGASEEENIYTEGRDGWPREREYESGKCGGWPEKRQE